MPGSLCGMNIFSDFSITSPPVGGGPPGANTSHQKRIARDREKEQTINRIQSERKTEVGYNENSHNHNTVHP